MSDFNTFALNHWSSNSTHCHYAFKIMDNPYAWPQGAFPSLKVTLIHSLHWIMEYSVRVMVLLSHFFCASCFLSEFSLVGCEYHVLAFLSYVFFWCILALTSISELSESLISGCIYLFGRIWIFLISKFILLSLMPYFFILTPTFFIFHLFYASFLFSLVFISCYNIFLWVIWKIQTFLVLLVAIFSFK